MPWWKCSRWLCRIINLSRPSLRTLFCLLAQCRPLRIWLLLPGRAPQLHRNTCRGCFDSRISWRRAWWEAGGQPAGLFSQNDRLSRWSGSRTSRPSTSSYIFAYRIHSPSLKDICLGATFLKILIFAGWLWQPQFRFCRAGWSLWSGLDSWGLLCRIMGCNLWIFPSWLPASMSRCSAVLHRDTWEFWLFEGWCIRF